MKKIFIYTFIIFIISSTKSFACNYSTGIIASFKKEHKICSKLVKSKPYLDKWQKSMELLAREGMPKVADLKY